MSDEFTAKNPAIKLADFEEQLTRLRDEIDTLDSELVTLLAKRRAVTTKVGLLKSEVGMPIFAPDREERLVKARRQQAQNAGLSPDLIEDILRCLMQDSYASQDASGYRCVNPNSKDIVIIGGKGQLGQIFVDLFTRSQYKVSIIEQDDWPNSDAILANASVVIVAVPIRLTSTIIKQLTHLPDDCILADVTSIKDSPLQEMLQAHQGAVVGLHQIGRAHV